MITFSTKILEFLVNHAKSMRYDLTKLPNSGGHLSSGDIIFFSYHKPSETRIIMGLIVTPPTKEARTGNELVSIVKIPLTSFFSKDSLNNLYSNRRTALPIDNYRTYILQRMEHIRRIEKSSERSKPNEEDS